MDTIEEVLKKAYSFDNFNLRENMNGPNLTLNNLYPHWRVLSSKGFLIETQNSTKESQKEKLNSEGIAVMESETVRTYHVPNYARLLYRFEDLIITVMKSEKQTMMGYQAYVEERRKKTEEEINS